MSAETEHELLRRIAHTEGQVQGLRDSLAAVRARPKDTFKNPDVFTAIDGKDTYLEHAPDSQCLTIVQNLFGGDDDEKRVYLDYKNQKTLFEYLKRKFEPTPPRDER